VKTRRKAIGRACPGFTLLEVLAALAIFGLVVMALTTAYVATVESRNGLRTAQAARSSALFVHDLVKGLKSRLEVEAGGEVTLPGERSVKWTAAIAPLDYTGLYSVTIAVEGAAEGSAARIDRFDLYRPDWATAAEIQAWQQAAEKRWQKTSAP
jgi:prepilin-type N-terminal cleavage/methylation domain-containing protein